jgi:hypothetical protein
MKEYDAFICHSSEDKRYFVRPLAQKLREFGANIWYDEFSLKAGLSLSRSIEKGISNSRYGVVVLSNSFFNKNWTEYELRALNTFEVNNPGIIIPLWYKVDCESVRNFSPYLADKLAIVSVKKSIEDIAFEILEVIREDLFEKLHQKRIWEDLKKNADSRILTNDELDMFKFGPIRHSKFEEELIIRIRLIRSSLFEVIPHSMEHWLNGFQRDLHPEDEVNTWERMATCYLEAIQLLKIYELPKKEAVLRLVMGLISGVKRDDLLVLLEEMLTSSMIDKIVNICKYSFPFYDFKDSRFDDLINES